MAFLKETGKKNYLQCFQLPTCRILSTNLILLQNATEFKVRNCLTGLLWVFDLNSNTWYIWPNVPLAKVPLGIRLLRYVRLRLNTRGWRSFLDFLTRGWGLFSQFRFRFGGREVGLDLGGRYITVMTRSGWGQELVTLTKT